MQVIDKMTEQTLNQEFHQYFNLLSIVQKESVLQMIKSFLGDIEDEATRISIEQYNKELGEAEQSIAAGEFVTHEQIKLQAEKW